MKVHSRLRMVTVFAVVLGVVLFASPAMAIIAPMVGNSTTPPTSNLYHVGDTINYSVTVNNPNLVAVTLEVLFRDPLRAPATALDAAREWAVGESQTYGRQYVITGTEPSTPTPNGDRIFSTASAVALDVQTGEELSGLADKSAFVLRPAVSVNTLVDFNADGTPNDVETYYSGSPAVWYAAVTNTGNCPVTVTLTDSLGHAYGAPFALGKGATITVPQTTASITGTTVNTVTAVGVDALGGATGTVTASDSATVNTIAPSLAVATSVDFDGDGTFSPNTESGYVGDTAAWRVVVTNTGLDPISNVTITDTNGHTFAPIQILAPGQSVTFEYDAIVNSTTTDDATATGTDPIGGPVTGHDDATAAVLGRRYADLRISKTADKTTVDANGTVAYTLKVENVGNGTAAGFVVTDDFDERYMDVVDANGGVVSGGKITWTITGPLAADGVWTITYKLKAKAEEILPTGKTELPNVVVVTLDGGEDEMEDPNPQDNTARFTVTVDNPFLPFTPKPREPKKPATSDDPYLPFTGSNGALLFAIAAGAAVAGLKLRTSSQGEQS